MKKPRLVSGIACVLVFVSTQVGDARVNAVSVSQKPTKPVVLSIAASKSPVQKKVNVKVTFEAATTHPKAPVIQTEVRVGTATCRAARTAKNCTVKGVTAGKTLKVSVRARNKNGFGGWSSAVTFAASVGATWTRAGQTSVPTDGGGSGGGGSGGGGSGGGSTTTTLYTPFVPTEDPAANAAATDAVKFDFAGAVGIARKTSVSGASVAKQGLGSNLLVVLESGMTRDAVIVGTVQVSDFLIAPNNKLYVLFSAPTSFGSYNCLLAQVYRSSGLAKCIESSLTSIDWNGTDSIQFDNSGNIYYSGSKGVGGGPGGPKVVRRYANGAATDYVNQYQSFDRFAALPNGDILISGYTSSNGLSWTRRITAAGAVSTLATQSADRFWTYPDGNVYFPVGATCLRRYLTAQSALDPSAWASWGGDDCPSPTNRASTFLSGFYQKMTWILANGKVMMVKNCTPACADLHTLYPTVAKANQSLKHITFGIPAFTSAILVGINSNGTNQMILYDSTSDSSSTIVDGSQEIEFYHVRWNASQNRVYFDGLRFADNKYVLGYVNLGTKQVVASDLLARLADFQTFSS